MEIKSIRALWGPNFWSVDNYQVIVMEVVMKEPEESVTLNIPWIYQTLTKLLPGLAAHKVIDESEPGFLKPVMEGTGPEMVIAHVALELQRLAGMDCCLASSKRMDHQGPAQAVFSYEIKEAGMYAGRAAVKMIETLIKGLDFNPEQDILEIKKIAEQNKLADGTGSLVTEANNRNIPVIRSDHNAYLQLGYGAKQKRIGAATPVITSAVAREQAADQHFTKQILSENYVPVPKGVLITDIRDLGAAIDKVGYPLVIKPISRNQGKAIASINVLQDAIDAFTRAKTFSEKIIVEKFITGNRYSVLVINYKLVAAAMINSVTITGDGSLTIGRLIGMVHGDTRPGNDRGNMLNTIGVDDDTLRILQKNQMDLNTVLPLGDKLVLESTANRFLGASVEDVTGKLHPWNVSLFERTARIMGLDICGIDVVAPGLLEPLNENGGAVTEINAAPDLRLHGQPGSGKPRNVAEPIIDMLFPGGTNGRIPIVAVTGTNGKTTTTRLIALMAQLGGYTTGYTATEGIYLDKELIYKGDCSGPASARLVLKDPAVEFAVFESARGGIIRSGLGFDRCDCAVVTNIAEDHLGIDGIGTIEGIAAVKSVVPRTVRPEGFAVLNADDDLAYGMKVNLSCNIALFSLHLDNVRIRQHCEAGGIAAVWEEGSIVIHKGNNTMIVEAVDNIPVTYNGKATFNVANALAATLAAYVTGICLPAIRCSLRTFSNSIEHTPGRMNTFDFGEFTVMVDYAHNPHGLRALGEYIRSVPAMARTGVIAGVGDRRAGDLIALGEEAAKIFDDIIIRMDANLRGRTPSEISSLLIKGIQNIQPGKEVTCFSNELDAVEHAINVARADTFTVILVENITSVSNYLQQRISQQNQMKEPIREPGPIKQKHPA